MSGGWLGDELADPGAEVELDVAALLEAERECSLQGRGRGEADVGGDGELAARGASSATDGGDRNGGRLGPGGGSRS